MNPAPSTPLFPDGSSPLRLYLKIFPDEEMCDLLNLSNDERGLYQTLRWYSLKNSGLPVEIEKIWEEVRYCAGVSRYKFFKLIRNVLERKFRNFDGRFFVWSDEEKVEESRDKVSKFRTIGKLGAERRWKKQSQPESDTNVVTMATPSDTPLAPSYLPSQSLSYLQDGEPAAAPELTDNAREDQEQQQVPIADSMATPSATDSVATPSVPVSDAEHERFCKHCKDNGITTSDRATSQRLKDRFPLLFPELPKLSDDQRTPGLWLNAEPERVVREANRQRAEALNPSKKPNVKEQAEQEKFKRVAALAGALRRS